MIERRRDLHGRLLPEPVPANRPLACGLCAGALTRRQRVDGNNYCSRSCARRHHLRERPTESIEVPSVLAILRANRHRPYWITLSDLAILRYGDDTAADLHAARLTIMRIRKLGYCFETVDVPWPTSARISTRGYRLVEADQRQEVVA